MLNNFRAHLFLTIFLATAYSLILSPAIVCAQSSLESPEKKPVVEEALTESIYLFTEDGISKKLYNMKFADFEELNRIRLQMKNADPAARYAIRNLIISGSAAKEFANLTFVLEIRSVADGWTRIPLRLNNLVLDSCKSTSSDGKFARLPAENLIVTYGEIAGYQLSFSGKKDETYQFTLKGHRAVASRAGKSKLNLNLLPNSPFSRIDLDVLGAAEQVEVSDSAILDSTTRRGTGTRIAARGPKGDFEISWRSVDRNAKKVLPRISSNVNIKIHVESANKLRILAAYDVKGFGTDLKEVRVRLPLGAELNPTSGPGYATRSLPEPPIPLPNLAKNQVVVVAFDEATMRPDTFIVDSTLIRPEGASKVFDLAGFEVANGFSESGTITIIADKKWQTTINNEDGIRQVIAGAESDVPGIVVKKFEFDNQPFGMNLLVEKPQKQTKITPVHKLMVAARTLKLETELKCEFTGESPEYLELATAQWIDGAFSPNNIVDSAIYDKQRKIWRINLSLNARQQDSLSIRFQSELPMPDPDKSGSNRQVEMMYPTPVASTVETATIAISPDDNILLNILDEQCVGTTPTSLEKKLFPKGRKEFCFSGIPNGKHKIVAGYEIQQRYVSVDSAILNIDPLKRTVETSMPKQMNVVVHHGFDVKYEPMEELYLLVPKTLIDGDDRTKTEVPLLIKDSLIVQKIQKEQGTSSTETFRYSVVEEQLADELLATIDPGTNIDLSEWKLLQIANAQSELFGNFDLAVRYTINSPEVLQFEQRPFDVWRPAIFNLIGEELVRMDQGIQSVSINQVPSVLISPDNWVLSETSSENITTYTADENISDQEIRCTFSPITSANQRSHVVNKLYCQTIMGRLTRTDRVAFRLETRDKPIRVRLPRNSTLQEAIVNGAKVKMSGEVDQNRSRFIESENVLICVIKDKTQLEHIIDISYETSQDDSRSRYVTCILPEVEDVSWAKSIYWELLTSSDEYFVGAQQGLMPLLRIDWKLGGLLARTGDIDHKSLESWVSISSVELPDQAFNRYVFFSFGPIEQYKVFVATRRDLVLVAAAMVLLFGSLLAIFPRARHPVNLLALVVVGVAFCVRYPDLALMFLQVAALATLLGGIVYLIQYALSPKDVVLQHVYWADAAHLDSNFRQQSSVGPINAEPDSVPTQTEIMQR